MLPTSLWLWDQLPLLQYVEFPWRLLGTAAVCIAFVGAGVASRAIPLLNYQRAGFSIALALLIFPNLAHLAPPEYHQVNPLAWTPDQIASRGVGVTTRREYEPRWLQAPLPVPGGRETVRVLSGKATIHLVRRDPGRFSFLAIGQQESRVEIPVAFFPGWQARVGDTEVPPEVSAENGLIQLSLPAGENEVVLSFRRTPARLAGEVISLLSLGLLIVGWAHVHRTSQSRTLAAPQQAIHEESGWRDDGYFRTSEESEARSIVSAITALGVTVELKYIFRK